MKKTIFYMLFGLFLPTMLCSQETDYDVVVVGGTPGGIMAAIAASRENKKSVILERSAYIGGLPVNGLGATDIATRGVTTGLFKEFVDNILSYYIQRYGKDSEQVAVCSRGYHFEPHVAAIVFDKMLQSEKDNITILTMRQFDVSPQNIRMEENTIKSITIHNRITGEDEIYTAKIFIDATYEGDLGAAAQVPFSIGREGETEYNEIGAGRLFKLWRGPELEGTTHEADTALQAYNYRLCLTNNPENRILPDKPKKYNRKDYVSLIDDVFFGIHAGVEMLNVTKEMQKAIKKRLQKGGKTQIPGDPWGIAKITNNVDIPNMKTDANNQHLALISTDLPEENRLWPTADWEWRDKYAKRLKDYTLGLIWFAQHDKSLPKAFRDATKEWGLARDEYQDNGNFPRQVYVREGRRLHGEHFFTANDARSSSGEGNRPPIYNTSITATHYYLDSHAVRKREPGKMALDGFFSYPSGPCTVPYGVILPQNVSNLLIPVSVSATHVGFSVLRMEPCWMALGQAAGVAAAVAIETNQSPKEVAVEQIQSILIKEKATLIYFKDVGVDNPDFEMVQYMGLRGYLPEEDALLDAQLDKATADKWVELSGINICSECKRGEALHSIYEK